jgi:hypothetical protein
MTKKDKIMVGEIYFLEKLARILRVKKVKEKGRESLKKCILSRVFQIKKENERLSSIDFDLTIKI